MNAQCRLAARDRTGPPARESSLIAPRFRLATHPPALGDRAPSGREPGQNIHRYSSQMPPRLSSSLERPPAQHIALVHAIVDYSHSEVACTPESRSPPHHGSEHEHRAKTVRACRISRHTCARPSIPRRKPAGSSATSSCIYDAPPRRPGTGLVQSNSSAHAASPRRLRSAQLGLPGGRRTRRLPRTMAIANAMATPVAIINSATPFPPSGEIPRTVSSQFITDLLASPRRAQCTKAHR